MSAEWLIQRLRAIQYDGTNALDVVQFVTEHAVMSPVADHAVDHGVLTILFDGQSDISLAQGQWITAQLDVIDDSTVNQATGGYVKQSSL